MSGLFSLLFAEPTPRRALVDEQEDPPAAKRARLVSLPRQSLKAFRVREHGTLLWQTSKDPIARRRKPGHRANCPPRALLVHNKLGGVLLHDLVGCHDNAGAALVLASMLRKQQSFDETLQRVTVTVGRTASGGALLWRISDFPPSSQVLRRTRRGHVALVRFFRRLIMWTQTGRGRGLPRGVAPSVGQRQEALWRFLEYLVDDGRLHDAHTTVHEYLWSAPFLGSRLHLAGGVVCASLLVARAEGMTLMRSSGLTTSSNETVEDAPSEPLLLKLRQFESSVRSLNDIARSQSQTRMSSGQEYDGVQDALKLAQEAEDHLAKATSALPQSAVAVGWYAAALRGRGEGVAAARVLDEHATANPSSLLTRRLLVMFCGEVAPSPQVAEVSTLGAPSLALAWRSLEWARLDPLSPHALSSLRRLWLSAHGQARDVHGALANVMTDDAYVHVLCDALDVLGSASSSCSLQLWFQLAEGLLHSGRRGHRVSLAGREWWAGVHFHADSLRSEPSAMSGNASPSMRLPLLLVPADSGWDDDSCERSAFPQAHAHIIHKYVVAWHLIETAHYSSETLTGFCIQALLLLESGIGSCPMRNEIVRQLAQLPTTKHCVLASAIRQEHV